MKPYCRSCRVSAICLADGLDAVSYQSRYDLLSVSFFQALPEAYRIYTNATTQSWMSCKQYEYDPKLGYKEG